MRQPARTTAEAAELLAKLIAAKSRGFGHEFCKRQIDALLEQYPRLGKLIAFI